MIVAKVIGTVVTTISHPDFKKRRLLVVRPLALAGEAPDDDFIALDNSQAGIGDTVLINREGGGARLVLENPDAPVISVIVGVIDSVYIEPRIGQVVVGDGQWLVDSGEVGRS
jgi:ethanolamine utilization protein EutN